MDMLSYDSSNFKIIAHPEEIIRLGDYVGITDLKTHSITTAQIIEQSYFDPPGFVEEVLRNINLYGQEMKENDLQKIIGITSSFKEMRILTCKNRGTINNGKYDSNTSDLPSRTYSKIEKISNTEIFNKIQQDDLNEKPKINIGVDTDGNPFYIDVEGLDGGNGLSLITGMKGTGKSHLAKNILLALVDMGAPILVFDLNGEYKGLKNGRSDKIKIHSPGNDFFLNLDYLGLNNIVNTMSNVMGLPDNSSDVLYNIWHKIMQSTEKKVMEEPITINNLKKEVEMTSNSKVRGALQERFIKLEKCKFLNENKKPTKFEDIIKPGVANIINLEYLPTRTRRILVEMVMSKLKTLLNQEGKYDGKMIPRMFLFAEEAHNYVIEKSWVDLITRMRHIGIYTFFITNQPDSLGQSIFRQLNNIFLFCFKNDKDLGHVSGISDIDTETVKSLCKNLRLGTCLGIGPTFSQIPSIIKVKKIDGDAMGESRTVFSYKKK